MPTLQTVFIFCYVILICLSYCGVTLAAHTSAEFAEPRKFDDPWYEMIKLVKSIKKTPTEISTIIDSINVNKTPEARVKREGGKFAETSNVSQKKFLILYLQMFKNIISGKNVGGSHPMHPDAVKPVVRMFKERIVSFFFPEVGESAEKH